MGVSSAVPALRRAQRLRGSTRPDRTVSPTAVTRYLLLVDAHGDRGVQRHALMRVLLRCHGTCGAARQQNDRTDQGTTRSLRCASASSLLCPVHVLQTQHKWATELARASGKSLSNAPLFRASCGRKATKVQVSSTVPSSSQPPRHVTGHPGHTFEATGAMCLASCGIDVWRLQLHGRWGSRAVLRDVRLSPVAMSLSLEASLGRDLPAVQKQILRTKA